MKWLMLVLICAYSLWTPRVCSQTKKEQPSISETMEWLTGAAESESRSGDQHITLENPGPDPCSVVITELRTKASPNFWVKEAFSLRDIDPTDIDLQDLGVGYPDRKGEYSVRFHTTNYRKRINTTSNQNPNAVPTSDYTLNTNEWFARKFAKAFKHAVELCGGKSSSF